MMDSATFLLADKLMEAKFVADFMVAPAVPARLAELQVMHSDSAGAAVLLHYSVCNL